MQEIQPDTPTVSTPGTDFSWTHGQCCEAESSEDEITDKEPQTLDGYNTAMVQIAGLSNIKIPEPLTFLLKKDWTLATKKERQIIIIIIIFIMLIMQEKGGQRLSGHV